MATRTAKELVSLRELSAEWHASRQPVRRALDRAGVRPLYLGDGNNGTLRYYRDEVDEFLRRSRSAAK